MRRDDVLKLVAEVKRLRLLEDVVRRIVTQRADNLCWRDVYTELATLVGVEFCPDLIADPEHMLTNCCAFVHSLRTGGKYLPVYVERASCAAGDLAEWADRVSNAAEQLG